MIGRPPLLSTFELPTHEELLALKVGDHAKLIFSEDGDANNERMWVRITDQGDNGMEWKGTLDNEPIGMFTYRYGDAITFHPLDICGTL